MSPLKKRQKVVSIINNLTSYCQRYKGEYKNVSILDHADINVIIAMAT
jgi:hypothetical protein